MGLERAGKRSAPDRFEREALEFFEQVRAGYLAMAQAEPKRYRVIDASQSLAEVSAEISRVIHDYLDSLR